ncbi:hypothetical protein CXU19_10280 [Akkermansia muciniphila]|nr:hypothetical protein CXU19_10280 [Akkermansia muciniphila]PNC38660.1 hypothetical protein CXU20_09185 [Akkermansia muciniphila]
MECSHVFDRKQSPWRTEVWFVPLSGFKPSAFRPTAKRFPGLRTRVDGQQEATHENPSNALIEEGKTGGDSP